MEKIKVKIKKQLLKIRGWVLQNPAEFWVLLVILVVGAFLRLYKIDQFMTFLGDEGRDVIIVRRIFTDLHPPLIGPGTSIGGMYLGPLYYYLMAPALLLAGFSPVGPAIQVALLGIVTIFFVWFIAREWFPSKTSKISIAGLTAAGLYAISPTVIIFSRSSWNPNIMPFFAIVAIYSVWKLWSDPGKKNVFRWLIVLGVSFAFVMQSHYLGLVLAPVLFLFWFFAFRKIKNKKSESKKYFRFTFLAIASFLFLMSPLLVFDIRHGWMNTKAIYKFFTVRQETVSIRPWNSLPKIPELFDQINISLIGGRDSKAGEFASVIFVVGLLLIMNYKWKEGRAANPVWILFWWYVLALVGFGLYKQQIYDHYYGFVFPIPFLITGAIVSYAYDRGKILKVVGAAILVYFVVINMAQNPLKFSPNNQLQRSKNVAAKIIEESGGEPFNLAVLAERNYEDGYRYFLELDGAKILHADRWDSSSIAGQLFVVCEMEKEKCDPTHSPKAEVANFGMTQISERWTVDGVEVYKLIHVE